MKKLVTITLLVIISFSFSSQAQEPAFQAGEWFKFRIHYGWFTASYATLQVEEATLSDRQVYHIKGYGESTGPLGWFFKVEDNYQSYIDIKTGKPYKFIRDINEGGYTKNLEIDFDHNARKANVLNKETRKTEVFTIPQNVHDMLSSFYYIRNKIENDKLKKGDEMRLNMFIDDENLDFKLVFLGREVIKTKFGKVATLKFRPYVMAGRVFKEKESLTFWISDDKNKIPIKIEADLAVGSLDADLDSYKGLKHPFPIIMN